MPADDPLPPATAGWSIFSVPRPIKRVFDAFPLPRLPAQRPPRPAAAARAAASGHALFLWTMPEDAEARRASFNPGCLKWQVGFPPAKAR